jgi:hypothetical protein
MMLQHDFRSSLDAGSLAADKERLVFDNALWFDMIDLVKPIEMSFSLNLHPNSPWTQIDGFLCTE